jgi:hypothetical protein
MRLLAASATALFCAAALFGCTTPSPVKDLAGRGVGATAMAEIELQRYLVASRDQLSARLVIVRQLSAAEFEENYRDAFSKFAKAHAGDKSGDDVATLIRTLGQEHRRLREAAWAEIAKLDEINAHALGEPISPGSESFAAVKQAFTTLAQELSPEEWLALTAVYAREIQATFKKLQDEIKASGATTSK